MKPFLIVVAVIVLLVVAAHSFTNMTYFCSECARERTDLQVRPFGLARIATFSGVLKPTGVTRLLQRADGGPCRHRWVFASGSGGAYL